MRIIAKSALDTFAGKHPDSAAALFDWYHRMKKANYANRAEVRRDYPHADLVGVNRIFTCFNIKGNKYRLIVHLLYVTQTIYIRDVLTHAEYSKKYC